MVHKKEQKNITTVRTCGHVSQVEPLLLSMGSRAAQQKLMCLRLAVAGLEGLQTPTLPATPASTAAQAAAAATPAEASLSASSGGPMGAHPPSSSAATASAPANQHGGAWADAVRRYPFLASDADR